MTASLRQVTVADVEPIALGAGILGTGGGGNPYLGSVHRRRVLRELGPQPVLPPEALADDAWVVLVGFIGAPTAGIEKLPEGTELLRAMRLLEAHLGITFDAVGIAEIGGANATGPLIAGRQSGLPTLDGDGMGRAFPELQMLSFLFPTEAGAPTIDVAPLAIVDAGDSSAVVPQTAGARWAERIARNVATSMGASAGLAGFVMRGAQFGAGVVPYILSLARELGLHVLAARAAGADVPAAIAARLRGKVLLRGKITDVLRRTTRGFARGRVRIEGFGNSSRLVIDFQNEYLIAWPADRSGSPAGPPAATVPDLICIVTDDTGEPVSTETLRYGTRVAVLAVPAAAALKTAAALAVVGPRAFGYDVAYQPLPGESIGLPPNRTAPDQDQP